MKTTVEVTRLFAFRDWNHISRPFAFLGGQAGVRVSSCSSTHVKDFEKTVAGCARYDTFTADADKGVYCRGIDRVRKRYFIVFGRSQIMKTRACQYDATRVRQWIDSPNYAIIAAAEEI